MRVKLAMFLTFMILMSGVACAETIVLKNGKTLNGKIIEKKNGFVKVDSGGDIYNFFDYEIKEILPESKENIPLKEKEPLLEEKDSDKTTQSLKEPLPDNSKDQNVSVGENKEENVNGREEE